MAIHIKMEPFVQVSQRKLLFYETTRQNYETENTFFRIVELYRPFLSIFG